MRIKGSQDFAAGIMFFAFGAIALYVGWDYPMGEAHRPGTGVLPHILSWFLMVMGAILIAKGVTTEDEGMGTWTWRPFICTVLAVVAFGLFIDDLGLIVTMILSLTICALGTPETRWREFIVFLALMIAIGVGMFVWALGMPIPTWPVRVPAWLTMHRA
jgi:hypothetical protein